MVGRVPVGHHPFVYRRFISELSASAADTKRRGDEMEPLDTDVGFETGNGDFDLKALGPPPVR